MRHKKSQLITAGSIIIAKDNKATIINKVDGKKQAFKFESQKAWKTKMLLESKGFIDFSWEQMVFTEKGKDLVENHDYIHVPYNKKKTIIRISKQEAKLTPEEKTYILQHEYTSGRWGQNIADAELNSNKDYVILEMYDHEIDYMFSESVRSKYWIYNLKTMKEFVPEGISLNYYYLHNSSGQQEKGVHSVKFNKENPYQVIVTMSDNMGGKGETKIIELPN